MEIQEVFPISFVEGWSDRWAPVRAALHQSIAARQRVCFPPSECLMIRSDAKPTQELCNRVWKTSLQPYRSSRF